MIIDAGTEAVGAALSITTYYLLSTPSALSRLQHELSSTASRHLHIGASDLMSYSMLREHCRTSELVSRKACD